MPGLGFVADTLKDFLEWVEDNPGQGAVAFAGVYIFTTVCFIPGSLLTLGAGLVFGRALGTGWGVLVGSVAVLVSSPEVRSNGRAWIMIIHRTVEHSACVARCDPAPKDGASRLVYGATGARSHFLFSNFL